MGASATISVEEITSLVTVALRRLAETGRSEITVPISNYWAIPSSECFATDGGNVIVLGDVWDDLEDLRKEALGAADDFNGWHAFDHIAGLMKLISYSELHQRLGLAHEEEPS